MNLLKINEVDNYLDLIRIKHNLNHNHCCSKRTLSDIEVGRDRMQEEKSVQTTGYRRNRSKGREKSTNVRYSWLGNVEMQPLIVYGI